MAQHPDYPNVHSMVDRHGKTRWRFRHKGMKDVMMQGEPHSAEFDAHYLSIIEGRAPTADVVRHPKAALPRSLKAAYQLLKETDEWFGYEPKTKSIYARTIERILDMPADGGTTLSDGPLEELERGHVKGILRHFRETPHMELTALICLKKLTMIGIDEEWIKYDPTYGIERKPQTGGHRTWPPEMMARFEAKWAIGTTARTAYALALWLGNRVSDVAQLSWSHYVVKQIMIDDRMREFEGFEFIQFKGRKKKKGVIFLPMTPMLARELAPLVRNKAKPILAKERGNGHYASVTLTIKMQGWCEEAGIPPGYTMHGLRKALGVKLAEADASTRQIMDTLGHRSIAYAELYSREASQIRLAVQAMEKVSKLESARSPTPPRRKPRLVVNNNG